MVPPPPNPRLGISVSASECGENGNVLCSYQQTCHFYLWFCSKPSDFQYFTTL